MPATLRVSAQLRRVRLVRRHRHAGTGGDPAEIAQALVALHSTDPASVHLSVAARLGWPATATAAVEHALYEERTLVRMLGMRRTVFVVPTDSAAIVHAAATRSIAARERKRLIGFMEENGITADGARHLAELEEATLAVLHERGEADGNQLGDTVPGLRRPIVIAGGTQSLTTRVLFVLAAEGRVVRGRPKGSWLSSQYRWSPAPQDPPDESQLPTADAQTELARAYLTANGPATAADLQWWTGWTAGEAKRALARLAPVPVDLDGVTGHLLPADVDELMAGTQPAGGAALLPALDPSVMGWTGRDFYLDPEHRDPAGAASLFDRSGNPGPTVWWDGRIVGGWAQRKDGTIAVHLLGKVGAAARRAIAAEAERATYALAGVRVTPRFRTPLERTLTQ